LPAEFIESGSSISNESGSGVLMTKNCKKNTAETNLSFFNKKLQIIYDYASIKDVQASGEAFTPQKNEIYYFFLFLWVIFALMYPDPVRSLPMVN
jgi:hypothetical protein